MYKLIDSINILGTEYMIKEESEDTNRKLEGSDGLCELYAKDIILDFSNKNDINAFDNIESYYHKVLRHECFHAIFHEAGFQSYCDDETLVNALAILYPKIKEIIDTVDKIKLVKGE